MTELLIRPCGMSDHAACLDVWLRASRVGHPFLTDQDLAGQWKLVRDVYLPNAETWVAVAAGCIVGFIGLLDRHIGGLFVDPRHHGMGVGRRLVAHAARLKGPLTVQVYEANRAVGFYLRCGFRITGRQERDDEGRALPLLALRLEPPTAQP
ncbi:MAG TPA: GNAT family N-acetyltransferase [Azospirillaceae bacterium]|nr:GNAT family N-acetyltransferase [Azospirillaceae bacterium]